VNPRAPRIRTEALAFQSASEYACAKLLEAYCGWRGYPGTTFQVPLGRTTFDFRVGSSLVEYHPISLKREFLTDALHHILSASRNVSKTKKAELLEAVSGELRAQYIKRRGQVASAHTTYRDYEVVCCFTPEEFIEKVVQRHATGPIAATEDLSKEFRRLTQQGRRVVRP
jgi:hypothetical protein